MDEGREQGTQEGRASRRAWRQGGRAGLGEEKNDKMLKSNEKHKNRENTSTLLAGFERALILDAFLPVF